MIKKVNKIIFFPLVISLIFLFPILPKAHAAAGLAFGGLDVLTLPCICEFGGAYWDFMVPFFNNSNAPTAGALVYMPGSITFQYYFLHPGAWGLGTYIPGAGICLMGFEPYCYPIPNYGLISFPTGTSI